MNRRFTILPNRIVRAVRELDRATLDLSRQPQWKVWVLVRGSSKSITVHAPSAEVAIRSAVRQGYSVTGLATPAE